MNQSKSHQTPIKALAEFASIPATAFKSLFSADEASDTADGEKFSTLPTISGSGIF